MNRERLEEEFGKTYDESSGRPGSSTRLLVALHSLKYTFNLSDDDAVEAWVENPYRQHFSGNQYSEHEKPIDPTVMSRFRKRIGEAGAEELLKETLQAGLKLKAIKPHQLKRINVDTTVQEKEVRCPADARLYNRSRERLVRAATERGIDLRQNYNRTAKQLQIMSQRCAHARQMKQAGKSTRKLRTILGRVIRDMDRKTPFKDEALRDLFAVTRRIHEQERKDKGKIYSVHEPHVECISKGKAHKRYEFGCKVSVAATPARVDGSLEPKRSMATHMTDTLEEKHLNRLSESPAARNRPSLTGDIAGTVMKENAKSMQTKCGGAARPGSSGNG